MRVDFSKLRFLIIDDNTFMRRMIKALLHGFGAREVFEAEDGASGLESFMSHSPDVVLVDWEMPILDGLEVTRMMRTPSTSVNPYVPIIMVSGYSEKKRVMQARDAGVSEFLAKPISSKALYDRILNVVAYPRPFVKTKSYFGPDRRRGMQQNYTGVERRKSDSQTIATHSIAEKAKSR
jgi:two-component system, chemotaxis family, chemotaxis protein CheY